MGKRAKEKEDQAKLKKIAVLGALRCEKNNIMPGANVLLKN